MLIYRMLREVEGCERVNQFTFTRDDIYREMCDLKKLKNTNVGVYDKFITKYGLAGYSYTELDGLQEVYVATDRIRSINESVLVEVDVSTLTYYTISSIEEFEKEEITTSELLERTYISKVINEGDSIYTYLMTKAEYDKEFRLAVKQFINQANQFTYADGEDVLNKVCRIKHLYTIESCILGSEKYNSLEDLIKANIAKAVKHLTNMAMMLNASVITKGMSSRCLVNIPYSESNKEYLHNAIHIKPIGETSIGILKDSLEGIIKETKGVSHILLDVKGSFVVYYKDSKDESLNVCNPDLIRLRDSIIALRESCDYAISTIDNEECGANKKRKNAIGRLGNSVRKLHKVILHDHSKF